MSPFFKECGIIASIQDLLENVEKLVRKAPIENAYLRGQPKYSWGLVPTIGRKLQFAGYETDGYDKDREERLLHQFRRYATAFPGGRVDERELLLLARHHGMPVRLLDWTSNPLVALYFACVDDGLLQEDGAIWMILRREHDWRKSYYNIYDPETKPILKLKGVKIIYLPYLSPRILAQSSHLTTQDDPSIGLEEYNPSKYKSTDFDIEEVQKWKILAGAKQKFIFRLQRCGINERAMFPDLDGIARSIARTEVLRTKARGTNRR
jgi:hypothetical protein